MGEPEQASELLQDSARGCGRMVGSILLSGRQPSVRVLNERWRSSRYAFAAKLGAKSLSTATSAYATSASRTRTSCCWPRWRSWIRQLADLAQLRRPPDSRRATRADAARKRASPRWPARLEARLIPGILRRDRRRTGPRGGGVAHNGDACRRSPPAARETRADLWTRSPNRPRSRYIHLESNKIPTGD